MELIKLFESKSQEIIDAALSSLKRAQLKSYSQSSEQENKMRLINLLSLTINCIKDKNLLPMSEYAGKIAKERFENGFDLYEVQTAFNVLEEELWNRVIENIEPQNLGEALGLVSTVLGAGKETLAINYVELASKQKPKRLNLEELFHR